MPKLLPLLLIAALLSGCGSTPQAPDRPAGPSASPTPAAETATEGETVSDGAMEAEEEVYEYNPMVAIGPDSPLDTPTVGVNLWATVRSDDGYLNLRRTASSEFAPLAEIPNGERVLVTDCEEGARGARWCTVERMGLPDWSPAPVSYYPASRGMTYRSGYVNDAELAYEPAAEMEGEAPYAYGQGVPDGYSQRTFWVGRVYSPEDGYVNLRTGPSSDDTVIREVPNGERVVPLACGPGATNARWCFVKVYVEEPGVDADPNVESPDGYFGYLYMQEMEYAEG